MFLSTFSASRSVRDLGTVRCPCERRKCSRNCSNWERLNMCSRNGSELPSFARERNSVLETSQRVQTNKLNKLYKLHKCQSAMFVAPYVSRSWNSCRIVSKTISVVVWKKSWVFGDTMSSGISDKTTDKKLLTKASQVCPATNVLGELVNSSPWREPRTPAPSSSLYLVFVN